MGRRHAAHRAQILQSLSRGEPIGEEDVASPWSVPWNTGASGAGTSSRLDLLGMHLTVGVALIAGLPGRCNKI